MKKLMLALVLALATFLLYRLPEVFAQSGGTGSISGTVTNSSGEPLYSSVAAFQELDRPVVTLLNPVAESHTDANGHYRFDGLAEGHYIVNFGFTHNFQFRWDVCSSDPRFDYVSEWYDDKIDAGSADGVQVLAGVDTTVDAQLEHASTISGRVLNSKGAPAAGVPVDVLPQGNYEFLPVSTDAGGFYSIPCRRPGEYNVTFGESSNPAYPASVPYPYPIPTTGGDPYFPQTYHEKPIPLLVDGEPPALADVVEVPQEGSHVTLLDETVSEIDHGCVAAPNLGCAYVANGPGRYVSGMAQGHWTITVDGVEKASGDGPQSGSFDADPGQVVRISAGTLLGVRLCGNLPPRPCYYLGNAVGVVAAADQ